MIIYHFFYRIAVQKPAAAPAFFKNPFRGRQQSKFFFRFYVIFVCLRIGNICSTYNKEECVRVCLWRKTLEHIATHQEPKSPFEVGHCVSGMFLSIENCINITLSKIS